MSKASSVTLRCESRPPLVTRSSAWFFAIIATGAERLKHFLATGGRTAHDGQPGFEVCRQ